MKQFSMGNAWSYGFRFFAGRGLHHAIVLIGLGLLLPLGLQFAMASAQFGTMSPVLLMQGATWTGPSGGALVLVVLALTFILQTASYFASWRLGLRADATLGGASLYGVLGGTLALAVIALIGLIDTLVVRTFWSPAVAFLVILIILLPVLAAAALFYTMPTVLLASTVALMLSLAMLFGTATGQVGMAATMTGGSGGVAVLLLVLSVVTIWLAARFSCTTSLMAERRSLNVVAAMRESWRLTWDEQWAITRYLALLGFGFALLIIVLGFVSGFGGGWLNGIASRQPGFAGPLIQLGLQVPFAFLFVMVPAGIYREVAESDISAEIFA